MTINPLALALASILLSVSAQFALKSGMRGPLASSIASSLAQPMVLFGLALYGMSALVWLAVLARWDVSKAYPLVGIGFALTVLIGYFAGEGVTTWRWVGVALICSGVVIVARS